jgi:hypothetical protein
MMMTAMMRMASGTEVPTAALKRLQLMQPLTTQTRLDLRLLLPPPPPLLLVIYNHQPHQSTRHLLYLHRRQQTSRKRSYRPES